MGAIHSTKISGNLGPKLNGSVRSNRKKCEKTGPPVEVDHVSRSDRSEFWFNGSRPCNFDEHINQPPFRTVCARIAVALVVFIKTPINHIFFKSLIIPDYGFELTKTIYLNVFRNWNALCKSTRLYKSCSTPAGNKRKKAINTAFASQHVPLKNRVSDF